MIRTVTYDTIIKAANTLAPSGNLFGNPQIRTTVAVSRALRRNREYIGKLANYIMEKYEQDKDKFLEEVSKSYIESGAAKVEENGVINFEEEKDYKEVDLMVHRFSQSYMSDNVETLTDIVTFTNDDLTEYLYRNNGRLSELDIDTLVLFTEQEYDKQDDNTESEDEVSSKDEDIAEEAEDDSKEDDETDEDSEESEDTDSDISANDLVDLMATAMPYHQ
jgi:hypothetical protein